MKRSAPIFSLPALLALLVAAGACSRSHALKLPDLGDSALAFGALYDAGDRVVAVGPVVTRQRLKAGGYTIDADNSGLLARLFLVKLNALVSAATAACTSQEHRADQLACLDLLASCELDATPCLTVLPAGEHCGDKLDLPRSMSFTAFESDPGGTLKPISDPSSLAETLVFCGPTIKESCPNQLPGFAITEGGTFRCAAPARQLGCSANVDLSDCGLGTAHGTIGADGSFTGALDSSACTIGAVESNDRVLGPRPGAFAISCGTSGAQRFVATPMETLFGEARCERRGPPVFNEAVTATAERFESYGSGHGHVTGLRALRPSGWARGRYLFSGTGHDDCAVGGCDHIDDNCDTSCRAECNDFVTLPDCAGTNSWAVCSQDNAQDMTSFEITKDRCIGRCSDVCNRGDRSACLDLAIGHSLVISAPDQPETAISAVDLDAPLGPEADAKGSHALAVLGNRQQPWVAIASRRRVRLFGTQNADLLAESAPARTTLDFDISGLAEVPGHSNSVIVFGDGGGHGAIQQLEMTDDVEPAFSAGPVQPAAVPTVDAVAVGGPGASWIFAASINPPLGSTGAGTVQVLTTDGSTAPDPITVPGHPTAIGALPGNAIAVAVALGTGAPDQLLIYSTSSGVQLAATLPLAGGLELTALAADPGCEAATGTCRVYLGYRQRGANRDRGNALVGLLEYDRTDASKARVVPSFVKTASEELSALEIDTLNAMDAQLIAVASTRNQITPIGLVE